MSDKEFWKWADQFCAVMGYDKGQKIQRDGRVWVVDHYATDGMKIAVFLKLEIDEKVTAQVDIDIPDPRWRG